MLLSRVADNVYWGARYLERAEDTARIVRAYTDLLVDLPVTVESSWEPLLAIAGSRARFDTAQAASGRADTDEAAIIGFLVADRTNPGSVASSIDQARENLRTTREVLPRDGWQSVNDLYLFSHANSQGAVERRSRARFLGRVVTDAQQIEGVIATVMSRDEAFHLWCLGRALERADMTTRVVGVRAAALLAATREGSEDSVHSDVQWMGTLRSVNGLQMYQRAVRRPVEGTSVVRFLLFDHTFPRSVASCVGAARAALEHLPHPDRTSPSVDRVDALLAALPEDADDGAALDAAMDAVQVALGAVNDAVATAFLRSAG